MPEPGGGLVPLGVQQLDRLVRRCRNVDAGSARLLRSQVVSRILPDYKFPKHHCQIVMRLPNALRNLDCARFNTILAAIILVDLSA